MRSLSSVVRGGLREGEALPDAYPRLGAAGVKLRRGDLHVVMGHPNAGKTFLALNIALKTPSPTLYFSNDSNEMTVVTRTLSYFTGTPSSEVEASLEEKKDKASDILARKMDHIRWSFDPAPSPQDIEEELLAFKELWGEYPHLTVVDVLMQVAYAEDSTHGSYTRIMQMLKTLARDCSTAMLVVHHASEANAQFQKNPPVCPPMAALQQKVSQLPALVLSVANHGSRFYIAPVKSRGSVADPSGHTAISFDWEPALARISEET